MLKVLSLICLAVVVSAQSTSNDWLTIKSEIPAIFWETQARDRFKKTCDKFPILKETEKAKNVIMFLGDGMGLQTLAASRFYMAGLEGKTGTAKEHAFEDWPFSTMCRTYDLETMVTDSASSATAYLTGTKTRTGLIGLTGDVKYKQCGKWQESFFTESVLTAAKLSGKSVGIVTTTRITHASPSGCFGHVSFRDFETDADIKKVCPKEAPSMDCQDLACQLIRNNRDINVIMGGGQRNFYPSNESLPSDPTKKGFRQDGKYLVEEWIKYQKDNKRTYKYIGTPDELINLETKTTDYVLALPYPDHMKYSKEANAGDPALKDYTRAAIEILQRNPKGYFLFVEGGRIDHAHHGNLGRHALEETLEFNKAIEVGMEMTSTSDTLLVVTADHSHAFELVGQPSRFRNILDLENHYSLLMTDDMPMTSIGYMNGPNGLPDGMPRTNPELDDTTLFNYMQQALIPLDIATHAGEDVGVYAIGPFSHLFHKTVDNTFVAQSMKFALGVKPFVAETKPCSIL